MKKALHLLIGLLLCSPAGAADVWCGGRIALVMADHPSCGGNMAFKTDATGGQGGVWMCTKSKEGSSLVLAAFLSEKTVGAFIEGSDVGGVCTSLPSYRNISYVIINP